MSLGDGIGVVKYKIANPAAPKRKSPSNANRMRLIITAGPLLRALVLPDFAFPILDSPVLAFPSLALPDFAFPILDEPAFVEAFTFAVLAEVGLAEVGLTEEFAEVFSVLFVEAFAEAFAVDAFEAFGEAFEAIFPPSFNLRNLFLGDAEFFFKSLNSSLVTRSTFTLSVIFFELRLRAMC
jgi:hypothetical protein